MQSCWPTDGTGRTMVHGGENEMGKDATPPPPERLAEIAAITDRAKAGDPTAVPRLRELLDEYPDLWEHYGNLASQGVAIWINLVAGNNLYLRESLSWKVAAL